MTVRPHRAPELHLDKGQLDLWLLTLPDSGGCQSRLAIRELDDAERRRADSFRRRADRWLYTATHIALRRVLGAYLRVPPEELAFSRARCPRCGGPHGRPVLAGEHPDVPYFSLSHSHGAALIGVADSPVGVDIEQLPRPERVEACASALHAYERRELDRRSSEQRQALFARLWTRKEAYLKGIGIGVGGWMSRTYLGDGGPGAPPQPVGWTVLDVPCDPGHAAAAAIRSVRPRTVVRHLPPEAVLVGEGLRSDTRGCSQENTVQAGRGRG